MGDEHYEQVNQALFVNPQDSRYDAFYFELDGILRLKGRMYVLNSKELRNYIVWKEVHFKHHIQDIESDKTPS